MDEEDDAAAGGLPAEAGNWVTPDGIQQALSRAGEYMLGGMSHLGALGVAADEMARDSADDAGGPAARL